MTNVINAGAAAIELVCIGFGLAVGVLAIGAVGAGCLVLLAG
jgi:hypothetical protein